MVAAGVVAGYFVPNQLNSAANSPYSTPSHSFLSRQQIISGEYDPKLSGQIRAMEDYNEHNTTTTNNNINNNANNNNANNNTNNNTNNSHENVEVGTSSNKVNGHENRYLPNDINDIALSSTSHDEFTIPALEDYINVERDPDSCTTLYGLYRSHCRGLIESLRFMHIKKFFKIQATFIGSLTAPVQKLMKDENVITWIKRVDWITYKVSFNIKRVFAIFLIDC